MKVRLGGIKREVKLDLTQYRIAINALQSYRIDVACGNDDKYFHRVYRTEQALKKNLENKVKGKPVRLTDIQLSVLRSALKDFGCEDLSSLI